ncbi:alpha/beta hydrolase [Phaeocystidibacter marisrubri]|uniref:Alpha/beta hydrolase n=1 Tax=Phaeocystidibacter marisrubri TaxID=1577780 RepID=A0A6L3ZJ28_9FLAO|nr:alpha/beta hydrolase [Phaeocystidibacter marisrubri]KAB2818026.1 alpha/beta hydrolase [Phaeocystidibacter marisrubri]GGH72327.1 alpha/beta hydrolase [Phaeocystidibacter marisrubri]
MNNNADISSNATPSFQIPKAYLRYVSILEFFSFKLAAAEITNRFFTPIPFKTPKREIPFIEQSKVEVIPVGKRQATLHTYGSGSKTAVFIHGWSGRGSQAYALAPVLVEAGYKVVAVTAPAHGDNPGKRTHMLQFADALKATGEHIGQIDALLAHSIGGAAAFNAVATGLDVKDLVILGAPSSILDVIDDFCTRLQLDDRYKKYIEHHLETHFYEDVEALSPRRRAAEISGIRGLIVHDKQDIDVGYEQAEALHQTWSGSKLLLTEGLGHRRILSDETVLNTVVEFLTSN